MIYSYIYKTKIGELELSEKDNKLISISFNPKNFKNKKETPLLKQAIKEINEYLDKKRIKFSVPIQIEGTEFQKKVWNELLKIPYGELRSYKQIAEAIKNPKAVRAVGGANNKNKIPIIIPCHRVIGKTGELVGYGGGLKIKETLIKLEKSN